MANQLTDIQLKEMCYNAKRLGFRPERLLLLDKRIEEWSKDEFTPSIAVRILRHGELAFEGAYGILGPNRAENSLKVDTIFPVCSLTKPVVATLLAIMQEEGLLDLNDPVRKYIPEFTGVSYKLVRIWHLLSHTSGLIDEDLDKNFEQYVKNAFGISHIDYEASNEAKNEMFQRIRNKMGLSAMEFSKEMKSDTYKAVVLSLSPTHKAGLIMSYCNMGYEMLMDIVKRVSGREPDEYFAEKLFFPCNMKDSYFHLPQEKLSRYVTRGQGYIAADWLNKGILNSEGGANGLKTTVHDMTCLGQMYLNNGHYNGNRILSSSSIRELTTDHNIGMKAASYNGEIFESTWGLGWNIKGTKKDDAGLLRSARSFEHGGFASHKLLCDPDSDLVAAHFTVSKENDFPNASKFNNMVIAAIDDVLI